MTELITKYLKNDMKDLFRKLINKNPEFDS